MLNCRYNILNCEKKFTRKVNNESADVIHIIKKQDYYQRKKEREERRGQGACCDDPDFSNSCRKITMEDEESETGSWISRAKASVEEGGDDIPEETATQGSRRSVGIRNRR